MRRGSRRYVVQFIAFLFILLLIIYLGAPSTSGTNARYAWDRVRYQTKTAAAHLPEPYGVCPGLTSDGAPTLVVASMLDDMSEEWLQPLREKYHLCVYNADADPSDPDSRTTLRLPANKGHEAMAYLTFIVDNYDSLPWASVFVHGSKFSWHNDHPTYSNLPLLTALNVTAAVAESGYHNLRCDWQASTCDPLEGTPQGSLEKAVNARLDPWNARDVSDSKLPQAFALLFGAGQADNSGKVMLERSQTLRSQCCAQFVVARESIHQHTRGEYVALRQWLLDDGVAPKDDKVSGRILSYLWHVLFIRRSEGADGVDLEWLNQLACPSAEQCYCTLYGRCGLEGCATPARCQGQYQVPVDFKVPTGWEEKYG